MIVDIYHVIQKSAVLPVIIPSLLRVLQIALSALIPWEEILMLTTPDEALTTEKFGTKNKINRLFKMNM
jgi:hypothetical protein